jgi:hypothetical protein
MLALAVLGVCGLANAHAQATNSGDIRGTVTDSTGALLPGATVTVTNNDTGVTTTYTTDGAGLYDTNSIVVGNYKLVFTKTGFAPFERTSVTLQVGISTVNAALKVGTTSQSVVVTTDIPLLSTETGSQSTTFDSKSMQVLPNVGQNWTNFSVLIPGASGTSNANPGTQMSVNGNLPYSNVLADGASTTLSHSQNSDVDTFETVSEVQVSTSAFSAQYGIGGVIYNQISKGGTSHFHGSAYDYFQNTALDASAYQFSNAERTPPLHYSNFGGSIGGPILKKKMFFYFNYDQIIDHSNAIDLNSVPTAAVMGGDFTGAYLPTLYDPTSQTIGYDAKGNPYPIRKSFESETGSNTIPSSLIDSVAAKFQQFYPTAANHIANGQFVNVTPNTSNGVYSDNFEALVPSSSPDKKYFGRLDYDITRHNRLTASVTQGDIPEEFPSAVTACPIGCSTLDVERYNPEVSDVWTISDRTVNEARLGYTYQGNFWGDSEMNHGYAAALGWQYAKADQIPAIQFYKDYPYAWIEPEVNGFYKENVFDPSDVVTMIRGRHVLHFGGEFLFYREDSTAYGDVNAGTFGFNGDYTAQWTVNPATGLASANTSTGADYGDFLLGYANSWSASQTPEYGGRLKSPEVFIQDDFKVKPNFTLNLGVRYQIQHGWNEIKGNEDDFDPTVPNTASGTMGAMWYGSTHANGRTSLQANVWNTVLPRVGFSWLPYQTMTIRGGFGMYAYNWSIDTYGAGMGAAFGSQGNQSDQTNGITPETRLDGTGTNFVTGAALPYVTNSTNPTAYNGTAVNYNEYHTPMPEIYQWNLSVQNQIGTNMVFELAYVASHAKNLNYNVDINQVPQNDLSSNDLASEPYPQYQAITGSTNNAISNYNSLQASITRRLAQGLSFNFNYVWSHFLDDFDSSGLGSAAGPQQYQSAYSPGSNYGNSNFDVRNAFKGNIVYDLPFGHGKQFLNKSWLLDEVVGGWQLSSTMMFNTGNPFTVSSTQSTYAQGGGSFADVIPGVSTKPVGGRSIHEWYNPAAFSLPANGTFGDERRNQLYGPGIKLVNISAGKTFTLHHEVQLEIRADATNAFNHPSWGQPNTNLATWSQTTNGVTTSQQPGQAYLPTAASSNGNQITGTTVGGRQVQLGARLHF